MANLFVRHSVKDYGSWRSVYDEADALRDQHGVRSSAVYRSADDPNDVTVMHGFDSIEDAKGLASDPALREAMDRAGVVGPPTIWFADEV